MTPIVATFYKFVSLPNYQQRQTPLLTLCQAQQIKGTILLAPEGINGTIAGSRQGIDKVLAFLHSDPCFADLEYRESMCEYFPFERMKVRLKKEIVTLGMPDVNPDRQVGTYVNAREWNQLLDEPDVLVIDTRNDYEVAIGTFKGAINPNTRNFREFPDRVQFHLDRTKHQKIAMFCTGGIRCEKASAFLLQQGFSQVYHLKGGILKYLEEIEPQESYWQGECFVFDERVAVRHGLTEGNYQMCPSCGYPIDETDKTSPDYQEGISCPHCIETLTPKKIARQLAKKLDKKPTVAKQSAKRLD